jgi:hypothetical protein
MQCQMMRSIRLISRLLLMSFSQTQNCECLLLRWRLLLFVLIQSKGKEAEQHMADALRIYAEAQKNVAGMRQSA